MAEELNKFFATVFTIEDMQKVCQTLYQNWLDIR
jgi:hypothetical protein